MSCQIVERCQAKGYCPASIPPPRRRKLRILCFRLKGGKRSRSAAPPLPSEPADAGLPRGPESRATSLYTREALAHTFRHCSPLTLGFPGAPKLRRPRRALPLYTIIDIPHCKNRHWPFPVKCGKIKGNTAQLRLRALAVLFPHKSAAKTLKYTKYSGVFATNL